MKRIALLLCSTFCFLAICYSCSSGDNEPNNKDTLSPTVPSNLIATEITANSSTLSWSASTDNASVVTYEVYKDGSLASTTQAISYLVNDLSPNTSYEFKLKAKDAVGNKSGFSSTLSITTLANIADLQMASGDLQLYLNAIIDNAPGSGEGNYVEPNTNQQQTWELVLGSILQEDLDNAVLKAGELNYKITKFSDTEETPNQNYYILEKADGGTNYWGTYVFSESPERASLIITAPHSKYDTNTGKEAVFCFKENLAKALFINGTHRCNSAQFSSCSGTTSACGASDSFRISDMAHTTSSMFQKTTEVLVTAIPNSVFVQLHGFAKQATDPYVIISNGTRETPVVDYAAQIRDALFVEDNTLSFKLAHIDLDWTRLVGFTNTQGRLINNSADSCNESAVTSSGRFIHIEQEKTKLRDDMSGWTKMSNALKMVF